MKVIVQPVYLVGREAVHVFALENQQLEVAIGADASGPKVRRMMERVEQSLGGIAQFQEPIVLLDANDRSQVVAAADSVDAILLSLSTARMDGAPSEAVNRMGFEADLWDLDCPILVYSGENTPMMAMYVLPPAVRRLHPNVHYCLNCDDIAARLREIKVAKVKSKLRGSKMIVLGRYNCADRLPDPVEVQRKLGVEMKHISAADFLRQVGEVDESAARSVGRQWVENSLPGTESSVQEIDQVARVQVGLETLLKREEAQAVSVGCLEIMYDHGHVPICWVLASLRDMGLPAGCEHDAGATLTMLMLEYLADRPAYMGNLVLADPARDLVSISHGCSPTRMWGRDKPAKPYRLVQSHSAPPFSRDLAGGSGVTSYVDYGDVGQSVTIARLGADMSSLFVARGAIVECRDTICDRTTVTVRVDSAQGYAQATTGNHQVMIYGDFVEDLEELGRSLGLAISTPRSAGHRLGTHVATS